MSTYGSRTRKNMAVLATVLFATGLFATGLFAIGSSVGPFSLNALGDGANPVSQVAGAGTRGTRTGRSGYSPSYCCPGDRSCPDRATSAVVLVAEAEEETREMSLVATLPGGVSSPGAIRVSLSSTRTSEAAWSQFQQRVSLARGPPLA